MVEIREESSRRHDNTTNASNGAEQNATGTMSFIDYIRHRGTDSAMCLLRLVTMFCTVFYVLPISSRGAQIAAYSKAFIAAAATNALRGHQRVGSIQFSREFLTRFFSEDSIQYLLYSLFFLSTTPVTMALVPIFLNALFNANNYFVKLCSATGSSNHSIIRKVSEFTNNSMNMQNMLTVVACAELTILPILIAMLFAGKCSVFYPLIYYRFIVLRYMSQRNTTMRMLFYNMRINLERYSRTPNCPQILRSTIFHLIQFACRLCPAPV